MYDIAVIGAGPAGLSAAINALSRNKDVIVFGRNMETSWIYKAEKVNNYLGVYNVNGKEMLEKFYEHSKEMGVNIKNGRVLQIFSMDNYFSINLENEIFDSKAVILATGIEKGKKIQGEEEYLGKGVSYCATCDGMLYRKKDVVVVGEIKEAEEDANFLSEICRKVYYISYYGKPVNLNENIELLKGKVEKVKGNEVLTGITINNEEMECDGVFFIKKTIPISNIIYGLETTDQNVINVNRMCETNIKGLFAAGDCTGWPYQISKAVGEGLIAAQQASKYIDKKIS